MSFICHIHNYTEYNQQWNVFSAFNPSKWTHLEQWAASTVAPGSSWWFGALLKGLTSVVNNSCRSGDSKPQPRITSQTLYPLGHDCPQQQKKAPQAEPRHNLVACRCWQASSWRINAMQEVATFPPPQCKFAYLGARRDHWVHRCWR